MLAAFVAMLGKQWLNGCLRHTGGSTIERCGDHQCKFDGFKWVSLWLMWDPYRAKHCVVSGNS